MATTLTRLLIHIVFSTKQREALIEPGVEADLYAYIGGICRNMDSPLLAINGTMDHVHMMVSMSKNIALADLLLNVKRDSSKWMHDRVNRFAWQSGYFAFSIGESGVTALERYIARQKDHHRDVLFVDEVRSFLRKYGVAWDEEHVWS